jgi:hypothetical protein
LFEGFSGSVWIQCLRCNVGTMIRQNVCSKISRGWLWGRERGLLPETFPRSAALRGLIRKRPASGQLLLTLSALQEYVSEKRFMPKAHAQGRSAAQHDIAHQHWSQRKQQPGTVKKPSTLCSMGTCVPNNWRLPAQSQPQCLRQTSCACLVQGQATFGGQ